MRKGILPRHFIRAAASNELSNALLGLDDADALIISQSFVCRTKKSFAKSMKSHSKGFILDPETYRYFLPLKHHFKGPKTKRKIRKWMADMSIYYPDEIKDTFGKRAANIQNFNAIDILEFCQATIEIQTSIEDDEKNVLLPLGIVAPYILIDSNGFSSKLLFQTQLIKTTQKFNKTGLPNIGVLYLSRDILSNETSIARLKSQLENWNIESIAIWIEGFDETTASEKELVNLASIYENVSKEKHTLAMYAGLAQVMMMKNGVDSIAHGVHYQMHKSGLASGGGPAYYFYIPNLRHRIRTIEASTIIRRQGFDSHNYCKKVCNCKICERIISSNPAELIFRLEGNNKEKVNMLSKHFIYNKSLEIDFINKLEKIEFVNWIQEGIKNLKLTSDEDEYIITINNWTSSILGIEIPVSEDDEEI